jgi:hypothetical protein
MSFSRKKIGLKLGSVFGFVLLLVAILSVFGVTKLTGMSNNAARIDADLANKARVSTINSSDNSYLHAGIIAQIEDRNSHGDHRQGKALHGWCPYRSQHLSSV